MKSPLPHIAHPLSRLKRSPSIVSSNCILRTWLCIRASHILCGRPRALYTQHFSPLKARIPYRPPPSSPHSSAMRQFSYSLSRRSQQTTFADPSRQDLFYHLISPPTPLSTSRPAFAISFLESPPSSSESSTILGWLPAEAEGQEQEAGLNDFKENSKFRTLLHAAISSGLAEGIDDIQINGAMQTQQGWMHIHDTRNVPALGRIGDPDDILASVRVEDGKILPETYSPMPSYRLCTADGVTRLTDGLAAKLRTVLEQRAREERDGQ